MNYRNHTDEDLLRVIHNQDPLATTDLEQELSRRYVEQAEENSLHAGMLEVLTDFDLDTSATKDIESVRAALQFATDYDLDTVRAVMDTALQFDIDTADALKPMLEIADQIAQVRDDATSDGIAVLNKIFNPTPVTA